MPTARDSLSTSVVNGKIYAIGGWGVSNPAIAVVEMYDPDTDKWMHKADMLIARCDLGTGAVNGKIYAIGGMRFDYTSLATIEEYDPEFALSVNAKGKLTTQWGKLKVEK
jgi:N-acetylneuraminic acid mutarotase